MISKTIDFANHKVNDEIRGYIYFHNGRFIFQYKKPKLNKKIEIKRIALVLESPHKDEFDIYYNPLHPTNGLTGKKINNKIVNEINRMFKRSTILINKITRRLKIGDKVF